MKKIISLILILASVFSVIAVSASAAKTEEFLSDIALIYEDSVEDAKEAIAGTDWKLFEQDLNKNADYLINDGVYLIYKTTTNVEEAITDLRVMDMYGGYNSTNYEKQLAESRKEYEKMVDELRIAAAEFKSAYIGNDSMAALAKMQMAFYKDVKTEGGTETGMTMDQFFMNMPSDDQVIQVLMEGNSIVVSNLITLLVLGISGGTPLPERIRDKFAIKDTLSDEDYHDDAVTLYTEFEKIRAKLLRYDALAEEYDLTDENLTEEEFVFMSEYASLANVLQQIKLVDKFTDVDLAYVLRQGEYTVKDFYPIAAAFSDGQMALIRVGQLETVLKYGAPTATYEELRAYIDEYTAYANEKYDGVFRNGIDVYTGVDRSIFNGSFAMTSEAERQQALTGGTWDMDSVFEESRDVLIAAYAIAGLGALPVALSLGLGIAYVGARVVLALKFSYETGAALLNIQALWGITKTVLLPIAAALLVIAAGLKGVTVWYNYYNPTYTIIPDTMIDVRETDAGDKYVKYTAAKVYNDEDGRNADFNAYQGREWVALYYTKDATAGNCLTPKFVHKDNDSTIARRHQGISMFGETTAFNLNSHVYESEAPGVYVTVRYSTAKKAAADVPVVVGSMFSDGAIYALCSFGGLFVGVGSTLAVGAIKRKRKAAKEAEELI